MADEGTDDSVKAYLLGELRKNPLSTSGALLLLQGLAMIFTEYPWLRAVGGSLTGLALTLPVAALLRAGGLAVAHSWRSHWIRGRVNRATPHELQILLGYLKHNHRLVGFDNHMSGVKTLEIDGVIVRKDTKGTRHSEFLISEATFRHLWRRRSKLFANFERVDQ